MRIIRTIGTGRTTLLLTLSLLLATACSSTQSPILYPNEIYKRDGLAAAELNVRDCMELAEKHGISPDKDSGGGKRVARNTAVGVASGAATGAAVGAFYGSAGFDSAVGAAGGGAGSAAGGLMDWLFVPTVPNTTYKRFVERALHERGYEVIGWE